MDFALNLNEPNQVAALTSANEGVDGIPEHLATVHASAPTQVALLSPREDIFFPTTAIGNGRFFTIDIKGAQDEWLEVNETKILMGLRLVKHDGTRFVVGDRNPATVADANNRDYSAFIDSIGSTFFRNIGVKINGQNISKQDDLYAFKADLENRFMIPKENKKGQLLDEGTMPETEAYVHANRAAFFNDGNRDVNFLRRWEEARESQLVEFKSRIHSPIFDQVKPLPPGTKITLDFERNTDDYCLLGNANSRIRVEYIVVKAVFNRSDNEITTEIMKITARGDPIKYQMRNVACTAYSKPPNIANLSIHDLFSHNAIVPRRIFMAMVRQDAHQGTRQRDPLNYQTFGINSVTLKIGGKNEPYVVLDTAIKRREALERALYASLQGRSNGITRLNYVNRNAVVGWDTSAVPTPPLESFQLPITETVNLDVTLNAGHAFGIVILIYAEYEGELLLDQHGKIINEEGT